MGGVPYLEVSDRVFEYLTKNDPGTEYLTEGKPGVKIYRKGTREEIEDRAHISAENNYTRLTKQRANKHKV